MAKTIIQHATVIDGSGKPPFSADVALADGKITAIGQSLPITGVDQVVDAKDRILTPGFIDPHTHSDMSILAAPEASGKISQGVTTDIIGNCGLSVFPVSDRNRDHLNDLYRQYDETITWADCSGYAKVLNQRRPAINIAALCGHNTLRSSVCGYEKKTLTKNELCECRNALRQSLSAGAVGFSTGLLYVPGKFSDMAELQALLEVLSEFDLPYTTHLRSEGTGLEEAVAEALELALTSGLNRLHISHLKAAGKANWHKLDRVIDTLQQHREKGLEISADRYPYVESMTQLSIIVPSPYDDMDETSLSRFLSVDEQFDRFGEALAKLVPERWQTTRLVSTQHPKYHAFTGEKMDAISRQLGIPASQVCAEILRTDCSGAMAAFAGMCPQNLVKVLALEFVCCGSDESARPVDYRIGRSHPRGFGSFPRFINILRKRLPIEQVIHRVTGLPASIFRLSSKGHIQIGYDADLVLLDLDSLTDTADFKQPHALSEGINRVWVNGGLGYDSHQQVLNRSGRFVSCR